MDEQGKIVSTCDIDENLALQMWTRGKTPRLSIFNKNKNSRKLIHIAWVEKRDRTLAINGKKPGETFNYVVQDFEPAIQKILTDYATKTNFKLKYFKVVLDLERALSRPEPASSKSDLAMMTEEKRGSLWVADCSGGDKNSGEFRPFFPVSDSEEALFTEGRMNIASISARGTESLIKTGITADLKRVNPERWHNPVRVTAAAMLLGFTYCGSDGTKMADALWVAGEKPKNINPNVAAMKIPEKKLTLGDPGLARLGFKLTAFIRHFYILDKIKIEYIDTSEKALQEAGYERQRRVDFNTGTLGDVPYRTTFYENPESQMTAFGCNPRMQTAKHRGDMVITLPTEVYKYALKLNTMSDNEDDFFTITRLLWAKQFAAWYENLKPYVKGFAGLQG
ncbi:MAG: hypothetical protein IJS40_01355 [Synergistaceae bacterium]|nr:hypothetical protein [Synergistaceae bacterium]